MIMPAMPTVEVKGDSATRIMARSGQMTAFSRTYQLWRFGFLAESDAAKAYGVQVERFLWVLVANKGGEIVETWEGFAFGMPEKMKRVERSKLWPTR